MITEAGAAISDRTLDSGLALVVGDSRRPPIGRAVVGTLATAAAFVVYVWVAKEVRPLYVHTSWADDPYDAVISFAFFIVPLMAGLCLLRVPLCQRSEPLPVRRAADLLLASRVTLAVVGVTLLSEWVSVILRVNRSTWTDTTRALIGVLGLMTAGAGTVSVGLSRALRSIPAISGNDGPEWAADILLVGERFSFRLGPFGAGARRLLRFVDRRPVSVVRAHPLAVSAFVSIDFGLLIATSQSVQEGVAWRPLLLFTTVSGCSLFAFLPATGSSLRVPLRLQCRNLVLQHCSVSGSLLEALSADDRNLDLALLSQLPWTGVS